MDININDLTLGDLEEIEDVAGKPASALFDGGMSAKTMQAVVYVLKRRGDPEFTIEDAKRIKVTEFGATDVPPTDAAA